MSEKRFECVFKEHETKNSWSMIKDNQLDKSLYIKDVVDLLNALHQENQKLQEKIMKVKQSNNHYYTEYYRIKEENEMLRQKLDFYLL